jgi:hypothetical protein
MSGGQTPDRFTLGYRYAFSDGSDAVELYVRSYDPSGPFQNIPDINRFTASLIRDGKTIATHDRQYND